MSINYTGCRDAVTLEQLAKYPIHNKTKYANLTRRVARDVLRTYKDWFKLFNKTEFDELYQRYGLIMSGKEYSKVIDAMGYILDNVSRKSCCEHTRLVICFALDDIYGDLSWLGDSNGEREDSAFE